MKTYTKAVRPESLGAVRPMRLGSERREFGVPEEAREVCKDQSVQSLEGHDRI